MSLRSHVEKLRKIQNNIKYKEIFIVTRISSEDQRRDNLTDSYYTLSGNDARGDRSSGRYFQAMTPFGEVK